MLNNYQYNYRLKLTSNSTDSTKQTIRINMKTQPKALLDLLFLI